MSNVTVSFARRAKYAIRYVIGYGMLFHVGVPMQNAGSRLCVFCMLVDFMLFLPRLFVSGRCMLVRLFAVKSYINSNAGFGGS